MLIRLGLKNIRKLFPQYLLIIFSAIVLSTSVGLINLLLGDDAMISYIHDAMKNFGSSLDTTAIKSQVQSMLFYTNIVFIIAFFFFMFTLSNHILKVRGKEFGIYEIIAGVKKSFLSKLIFVENLIIYASSVIIGIIIAISIYKPLLALMYSFNEIHYFKDFKTNLNISSVVNVFISLMISIIVADTIIFIRYLTISPNKLFKLITSNETNTANPKLDIARIIIGILSLLGLVYLIIQLNGLVNIKSKGSVLFKIFFEIFIPGIILIYTSVYGLLPLIIKTFKKILMYFKLNIFTFSQLSTKINSISTFIATSIIMVSVSLAILVFGSGMVDISKAATRAQSLYDVQLNTSDKKDADYALKEMSGQKNTHVYSNEVTMSTKFPYDSDNAVMFGYFAFLTIDEYDKFQTIGNRKPIDRSLYKFNENGYNFNGPELTLMDPIIRDKSMKIAYKSFDGKLKPKAPMPALIIFKDEAAKAKAVKLSGNSIEKLFVVGNYTDDKNKDDAYYKGTVSLISKLEKLDPSKSVAQGYYPVSINIVFITSILFSTIVNFIAVSIMLFILILVNSKIAFSAVADATKYRTLAELGFSKRQINYSILKEIVIFISIIILSSIAIVYIALPMMIDGLLGKGNIFSFTGSTTNNIFIGAIIVSIFVIIVTHLQYKFIVKNSNKSK